MQQVQPPTLNTLQILDGLAWALCHAFRAAFIVALVIGVVG